MTPTRASTACTGNGSTQTWVSTKTAPRVTKNQDDHRPARTRRMRPESRRQSSSTSRNGVTGPLGHSSRARSHRDRVAEDIEFDGHPYGRLKPGFERRRSVVLGCEGDGRDLSTGGAHVSDLIEKLVPISTRHRRIDHDHVRAELGKYR